MIALHVIQLASHVVPHIPVAAPQVATDLTGSLSKLATAIETLARTLGLVIFLVCVIVAGIMRMVAFGSERRIQMSNMALTAAVIGLVIMLLAAAFQTF